MTLYSFDWWLLFLLITFRITNSLLIFTAFDPDEYWQSLEVAHRMIFGYGYLTWEWREGLRSYLHPLLFAFLYKGLQLSKLDTAWNVIHVPRVLQGILAAIGDFFLWKLSKNLFNHQTANWILICQLANWFMMYSFTRTYSNSLETVLTLIALYYWSRLLIQHNTLTTSTSQTYEYLMLIFCGFAILIRPTNAVIWIFVVLYHFLFVTKKRIDFSLRLFVMINGYTKTMTWSLGLYSSLLFSLSLVIDWIFYGKFTFVMWNFFRFNVLVRGSSFYGTHPIYWYFTHAIPTVTFSFLIPMIGGVFLARHNPTHRLFLFLIFSYLVIFSFIAHKEFRFLMPILPLLMLYCGYFFSFCASLTPHHKTKFFKVVTLITILLHFPLAFYFMTIHQRGTIDVMFRLQEEADRSNVSVYFLMPCHSTPYYAYIHKNISMDFLDCSPKFDVNNYIDEADRFFANPAAFLQSRFNMNTSLHTLPTHFVFYDVLLPSIHNFLVTNEYYECARFFHTQVPSGRRIGTEVLLYCHAIS